MVKIDTSEWREFEIGKLFDIVKGTRLTKANMIKGSIRFIGSSAMNNGLTTLIANDEKLHPANTITVCYNGSVGETFYQDKLFWASDDVNVLYPRFAMTKNVGLFIAPLIRSTGQRYAFVDKWRMDVMKKDCIKLPVDSKGSPDWAYMDSFMAEVMKESEACLENLRLVDEKKESVDISSWKEFSLSEIGFSNYHGQRLNKAQRIDGNIPFVTAGFENRGISQYIGNDRPIYEKAITIDMFGNCFFQSAPCAGDDNVYFFVNNGISDNAKLFISVCIQAKILTKYAYVRQFRQPDADNLVVALPADLYGSPDWAYMDSYMQDLMYETKQRIDVLTKTISQD